jgi:ubiquinone/menaquinone biosynthesis C-methylase UbiE
MSEARGAGTRVPRRLLEPPRKGLYKRFFAWLLYRLQSNYGEEIDARKRRLFAELHGTVVEIGAGAGANLEFYPADVDLILVEPNAHLHPYLRQAGERHEKPFALRRGTAEHMDVADAVADFVVSTLVLCSVDDQTATLGEIRRVLKSGGKFVFVEHVAAPRGTRLRRWQGRLRRFWRAIGDGCTLDRETWASIEEAGFDDCEIEHFDADNLAIARPHIAGTATKG